MSLVLKGVGGKNETNPLIVSIDPSRLKQPSHTITYSTNDTSRLKPFAQMEGHNSTQKPSDRICCNHSPIVMKPEHAFCSNAKDTQ